MDFKGELASRILRLVAIVALVDGLFDAARLLGVWPKADSPMTTYGAVGFAYLAVFCLAKLFASVGLWIKASWGSALLVGATTLELVLFVFGMGDVNMSIVGFVVRALMVATIAILFALSLRLRRAPD